MAFFRVLIVDRKVPYWLLTARPPSWSHVEEAVAGGAVGQELVPVDVAPLLPELPDKVLEPEQARQAGRHSRRQVLPISTGSAKSGTAKNCTAVVPTK